MIVVAVPASVAAGECPCQTEASDTTSKQPWGQEHGSGAGQGSCQADGRAGV